MKLEQILKTGRNIILSSILAVGLNTTVQAQAASGWGVVRDTNDEGQNLARVTYIMAENESQCLDINASGSRS